MELYAASYSDVFAAACHKQITKNWCNSINISWLLVLHALSVSLCLVIRSSTLKITGGCWLKHLCAVTTNKTFKKKKRKKRRYRFPNYISASHPPAACLWKRSELPSRSLQILQTLGHYRERGQAATLNNTHSFMLDYLLETPSKQLLNNVMISEWKSIIGLCKPSLFSYYKEQWDKSVSKRNGWT